MRTEHTTIATLALIFTMMGAALGAQASKPTTTSDTYTWHAEFVGLDATGNLTVKPRVAYEDAVKELKQFKAGERVWILWSGVHDYSDAVRQIRRPGSGGKIDENLVLPAELVSTEAPNQYITIRVRVPESSRSGITAVKPGEWVTITSRQRPSTDNDAVVAVKPYGSTTSTE
jgi:hypothetical protein